MPRTLSDEDVQAIAKSVVDLIGGRLTAPPQSHSQADADRKGDAFGGIPQIRPKLAYTAKELCAELSLSRDTIYKLESAGRLKSIPGIRHKIYSRAEVERLLRGGRADWQR
jgi:DNA-binding XRE family transcriptional regulator